MKKTLRFSLLSMLLMLCGTVFADDAYYTLDTTDATNKTKNSAYANEGTATVESIEWAFQGNGTLNPWRLGGKNLTDENRVVYTKTAMDATINSIKLAVGEANSITVNSLKLIVASDDAFSNVIDEVSEDFEASTTITFEPTSPATNWAANSYYKFVFNVSVSGSSNKFVEFKKVEFFGEGSAAPSVVYTVAGTTDLTGYDWDATQNKMTLKDDLYQWTAKDITVTNSNKPEFKVVKTEGENQTWYPNDGNWVITPDYLGAEGIYDITITFNAETSEIGVTGVKTSFNTIAELNALENNKTFTFFGEALVVAKMAKSDGKTYVYIKDDTGASLIYDKDGSKSENIAKGMTIAAPWAGKVSIFSGLFEAVPNEALTVKDGEPAEISYDVVTADDVKEENVNKVVLIKGLSISNVDGLKFTIGDAVIAGYNQFGINLPEVTEGKTFDIVGAIGIYTKNETTTIQFQPIEIKEIVEPVLNTYTATFTTDAEWEKVYAYAWSGEGETVVEFLGKWPGTELTANEGVYTVTIKAEAAPEKIIFNNGDVAQTADLAFEDGKAYTYTTEVPAQTATFNFADPNFRENIGESITDTKGYIYNETFTAEGATLQITAGSTPARIYTDASRGQCLVIYNNYGSLIFRAPDGKAITKIEFTAAGNSNINKFTASSGTIEGMTWTGDAEGVRFMQGANSYLANAIVTMTDKTAETTALPAIEYTECANIAAFNALAAGTYAKVTLTDAEVIGKSADGYSTVWIQDATGGCWIQYTSLNDKLAEKTKVNGTVYAVLRAYSGNPQMKEAEATLESTLEATAIEAYTIVEGSIAEVNVAANLNKVVKITGATLEMTSATAGNLTIGETSIYVNNGNATANQLLCKIADWEKDKKLENVTIEAILVAKSATENQLLPISMKESEPVLNIDITNASFEADGEKAVSKSVLELTGWTFAGVPTGDNVFNNTELRGAESASTTSQFGHSAPSDGNYSLFFRSGWNGSGVAVTLTSDALTELPAGAYTLSVDYKQHYSYDNTQNNNTHVALSLINGETTMATIKSPAAAGVNGGTADATYFNDTEWSTLELPFTIAEAITGTQVVITFNAAGQRRSDFFIDNVKLVKVPAIQVALAELKSAIEAAEAKAATYTVGEGLFTYAASAIAPLTEAIATAQAAYEAAASAEAVEAATTALNAFVAAFAPEMTKPAADKTYTFQLRLDGETPLYMALAEGGITIAEEATPLKFIETETAGQYNLANADETLFVGLAGGNVWTMSTAADKKAAWTFTALPDGAYRINNLVTTGCFVGTNAADKEAGKPCYADKKTDNGNVDWIITEVKEEPVIDKLYIMGNGTPNEWTGTTEMTFNEEAQAFEYTLESAGTMWFTFADIDWTASPEGWNDFNANHRYAIGEGDQNFTVGETVQLVKVNGTLVLEAGKYTISVTKDLKCTAKIVTGINDVKKSVANGTIYNLNGQKVEKAQKGLYIINGKVVVIK